MTWRSTAARTAVAAMRLATADWRRQRLFNDWLAIIVYTDRRLFNLARPLDAAGVTALLAMLADKAGIEPVEWVPEPETHRAAFVDPFRWTIHLPPHAWCRQPAVVAHELVHAGFTIAGHGPRFVRAYIDVLGHLGCDPAHLRLTAKQFGVAA